MVEHVGEERIDLYMQTLHGLLRPGGRLLNHGIAKLTDFDTKDEGAFSERFVFPDGVPLPLSRIELALERSGLVTRHVEGLADDYAETIRYWIASFEERYDEAVRVAGIERARVWRVYLRAARQGFLTGWASVYQVLADKPTLGVSKGSRARRLRRRSVRRGHRSAPDTRGAAGAPAATAWAPAAPSRAEEQRQRAPTWGRASSLPRASSIDGRSGSGLGQREHGGDQDQVVLVAAVGHPRAVLEVDAIDGGEHRGGQRRGGQRSRGAEHEQGATPASAGRRRARGACRAAAEVLEELAGALEAVAAEPAEQLLGAVADEEATDGEAKDQASNFHARPTH